ncbi:tyrosyl-tRNA synthetase [Desulfitobacterium hafniense DCB-2]|uniref:Tyrosine--tRNA ligase n=2 Tax=Desulfitobacterium hafniense TaxID=49338 RepID=A0A0W1JDD6_DESHA|nr:tyrosine--tRNA ligase [Desulfitobacterium hafniense]ACL19596.1 tyrosyl-tRNA synthetase [Desulfitobacterium hafniense DCB-2]KTE89410.1 tyrosine--tRNA ligase [Desulfitobacterium hafniense]
MQTIAEQFQIITKGVSMLVNAEELKNKLAESHKNRRPLVIKLGLDPSAPDIHLGHAVVLRKIKQLQDLGHEAVIVIGDFTGKIGDPSGKAKGRTALSDEQVKENARTYFEQIFKVLDKEKTTVRYNSEWLSKLNFEDVLKLAATTTVARMLERDDFQKRFSGNVPIGIHEFFYPLMQAYDSVALQTDIELGGTDQTFNILMGRTLQKAMGQPQQIAMFMPLLEGLDGVEKMSKSLGNYIGVYEPAPVMFKKVMEVPDPLILKYFELATDEHPDRIEAFRVELAQGKNPRDVKYALAEIITRLYHTEQDVMTAKAYYEAAFSKKAIPAQLPVLPVKARSRLIELVPLLVQSGFTASNGEFRRLVQQGGVQLNQQKISDLDRVLADGDVLKIGKKCFVKIVTEGPGNPASHK